MQFQVISNENRVRVRIEAILEPLGYLLLYCRPADGPPSDIFHHYQMVPILSCRF